MAQSKEMRTQAKQLQGRPVCVTLHNGQSYIGWISGIGTDGLELAGTAPGTRASSRSASRPAAPKGRRPSKRGAGPSSRTATGASHAASVRHTGRHGVKRAAQPGRSAGPVPGGMRRHQARPPVRVPRAGIHAGRSTAGRVGSGNGRLAGNASGSRRAAGRLSRGSHSGGNTRTRRPGGRTQVQVSAFLPMLGSMMGGGGLGGLGGLLGGSAAGAGGLGGMLGGGMRLFGMVQRFVPVVKMGYGMIKSIKPFLGAVQGLMIPAQSSGPASEGDD